MVDKKEKDSLNRDVKSKILDSCNIEEFIEAKLKKFMPEMSKHQRINLYKTVIDGVEKALIKLTLRTTDGNQLWASKILGISRNTLREKMKRLRLIEGDSKQSRSKTSRKRHHDGK